MLGVLLSVEGLTGGMAARRYASSMCAFTTARCLSATAFAASDAALSNCVPGQNPLVGVAGGPGSPSDVSAPAIPFAAIYFGSVGNAVLRATVRGSAPMPSATFLTNESAALPASW